MWHNGCVGGYDLDGIYFRDNGFLSIEKAKIERDSLVPLYAYVDGVPITTRKEHKNWVPFAGFNGVINLVVCGEHIYGEDLQNPVITVGGGELNIVYDSITSMLKTSIDWVDLPEWAQYETLPPDLEREIWAAHNPGIWNRRARAESIEREKNNY